MLLGLKKVEVIALGVLFIISPTLIGATTIATTTPTIPPPIDDDYGTGDDPSGIFCPNLSITMKKGARDASTGGQVSELQAFLTSYYDLDENIVVGGYFGKLTHKYVVQFQSEHGLPAFGIVGSLTRAKIKEVCGGVPGVSGTVDSGTYNTASPMVTGTASGVSVVGVSIDNGDKVYGSGNTIQVVNRRWSHTVTTFLSTGTYNVSLYTGDNQFLASGKIMIEPGANATLSVSPTSGIAPLAVNFTISTDLQGPFTIDFGDSQSVSPATGCYVGIDGSPSGCNTSASHTYTSPGTYTAKLLEFVSAPYGAGSDRVIDTATITVTGSQPPLVRIAFFSVKVGAGGIDPVAPGQPAIVQFKAENAKQCDMLVMNDPNGSYLEQYRSGAYKVYGSNIGSGGEFGSDASLYKIVPTQPDTMILLRCNGYSGPEAIKVLHIAMKAPPPPPSIAPPAPTGFNGQCVGGGMAKYTWDPTPGATYYLLRVNDPTNDGPSCRDNWTCEGTTDVRTDWGLTEPAYTFPIVPDRSYQTWLLACNVSGCGPTVGGPKAWCPASNGVPELPVGDVSPPVSSTGTHTQLANALTALEEVLKALIAKLGQ